MILQALTQLYEDLAERGEIPRPGWSPAKISYALCLDEAGNLLQVIPTLEEKVQGKKTILAPQSKNLPAAIKRTVGISPNFLWDNSSYLLGADAKGKADRSIQCFAACKKLHQELLGPLDSPVAKAIVSYFDHWEPENAQSHPALMDSWEDIMKD